MTANPTQRGLDQRACRDAAGIQIWQSLFLVNLLLSTTIACLTGKPALFGFFCGIAALFVTMLATAPYARFLSNGWWTRHDEFRNELYGSALLEYLTHFWNQRALRANVLSGGQHEDKQKRAERTERASDLFDEIYREQYGMRAFATPLRFLVLFIFLQTHFIMLMCLGDSESATEILIKLVNRVPANDHLLVVSALSGAYLFVVGDSVDSVRKGCLNSSDVYWYALRILLAVPIAWSLTFAVPSRFAPQIAFALGALPVNFILKQLRSIATAQLKAQPDQIADQLIKLDGVTAPTVALLTAEGVTSIDQLLGIDPVLLSIHTGLPFRSVLRLCSQAIVRRHFGDAAFALSAVGLSDAPAVFCLVQGLRADPTEKGPDWLVLNDVSVLLKSISEHDWPAVEVVRFGFENIASFTYTHFLMAAGFEKGPRHAARIPVSPRSTDTGRPST
jgi:hypothetical protein